MDDTAGWLAHLFHFPPFDIEAMTMDDQDRWIRRANKVGRELKKQQQQAG